MSDSIGGIPPTNTLGPTRTVGEAISTNSISYFTFSTQSGTRSVIIDYIDSNGNFYNPSSSSPSPSTRSTLSTTTKTNSISVQSSSSGPWNSGIYTDFITYITPEATSSSSIDGNGNQVLDNGSDSQNSTQTQQNLNNDNQNQNQGQLGTHVKILIAALVTVAVVGICLTCCLYKRRRRRLNNLPGGGGGGNGNKTKKWNRNKKSNKNKFNILEESKFDIQALPSPLSSTSTQPPRFSQMDLDNILISQRQQSPFSSSSNSPFIDPPTSTLSSNNTLRPPSSTSSRRIDNASLYTDNSEFDMLAQDGSSYTRTLSTYSEGINSEYSERDLGSYIPYANNTSIRPRLEIDTKSPDGPSSNETEIGSNGWNTLLSTINSGDQTPRLLSPLLSSTTTTTTTSSSRLNGNNQRNLISPFSDPFPPPSNSSSYNTQPPISPISTSSTNRSWRTEDEILLMAQPSRSNRLSSNVNGNERNGLGRNVTIVRHTDAGRVNAPRTRNNDQGTQNELHFPPSYGDIYPQN